MAPEKKRPATSKMTDFVFEFMIFIFLTPPYQIFVPKVIKLTGGKGCNSFVIHSIDAVIYNLSIDNTASTVI